jgi:transposase-like protein
MFKHHRYPKAIILQAVYFKLRFTLSYRDVDKYGDTIDFLLTKRRMKGSAQKFLNKAIRNNGKATSAGRGGSPHDHLPPCLPCRAGQNEALRYEF